MSFTPKNVAQLLVATTDVTTAYEAAGTAAAKKATLVNVGDYAIVKTPNPVPAGSGVTYVDNASVGLIVKTASGLKVSEQIVSADLDSYTESVLVAGAAQKLQLTYPAVSNSTTYVANIVLHDHIGSVLNERFINAYVNIDAAGDFLNSAGVKATATLTLVAAELASQLQASIDRANEGFVVTSTATTVVVEGAIPAQKIGAVDGLANRFEFIGGTKELDIQGDTAIFNEAAVGAILVAAVDDGLVQLKNIEWFYSGYDKDPYRDIAWPASFGADSNVGAAGVAIGDSVGIYQFHKDRKYTNMERQHRQLIVVGDADAIKTGLDATTTTA